MIRNLIFALIVLLVGVTSANAQTILQCYNSNTGFSTTQPCPGNKTTINSSAVIATANTFQTIMAANSNRASITVENNNASDNCWITVDGGSPTKGVAILLLPGGSYQRYFPYVPSAAIQATCASNSDPIYADYQ